MMFVIIHDALLVLFQSQWKYITVCAGRKTPPFPPEEHFSIIVRRCSFRSYWIRKLYNTSWKILRFKTRAGVLLEISSRACFPCFPLSPPPFPPSVRNFHWIRLIETHKLNATFVGGFSRIFKLLYFFYSGVGCMQETLKLPGEVISKRGEKVLFQIGVYFDSQWINIR